MIIYILIFFAKIIEVSLMTIRTVLLTKGQKFYASVIGFFEVIIWLLAVSSILTSITEDPLKVVVYAGGFSIGCYFGSWLEEKIALGLITIQIIVSYSEAQELVDFIRENKIGVTLLEGMGKFEKRGILIIHAQRNQQEKIIQLIKSHNIKSVISSTEVKLVSGGYGLIRK